MKFKSYLYQDKESKGILLVRAKKQPSLESQPRCGTWVLRELKDGIFEMPCFPEVTIGIILKRFMYLGELK